MVNLNKQKKMRWTIMIKDLGQNQDLLHVMLEGQKKSLDRFGLKEKILNQDDWQINPHTFSVVAISESDDIVGAVRIYARSHDYCLPLEGKGSYLPEKYRGFIQNKKNICEIRGLWVAAEFSGRSIASQLVQSALLHCYTQNYTSVVGTAQVRTYKHLVEPLGFIRDINIPAIPFPDDSFETIVTWHHRK